MIISKDDEKEIETIIDTLVELSDLTCGNKDSKKKLKKIHKKVKKEGVQSILKKGVIIDD